MDSKKILSSVKLPTLSKTLYNIIELEKRNPVSILRDIKTIIEKDPLLSAHVLSVANSSLYGFSQKVRTISHAISLLGVRKIRSLAFVFSIFDFLKKVKYQPQFGKTFNLILKKSLLFSAVSMILAQRQEHINAEELYLSGLLADIGQMILFLYNPEKYRDIYSTTDHILIPSETKIFNTNHIVIGKEFCEKCDFPDFINSVITSHAELSNDDGYSKIAFIANQLVELLLDEQTTDKETFIKELENNAKKLLRLSLSEVEEAIKHLPQAMETYTNDFPELQDDLSRVIETGSTLILSLMKKKMDMVILAHELTDSQKRLAKEKLFLGHMLNLSYFLSSLMPPQKIISSLFEYFEKYIHDFSIEFVYKLPGKEDCLHLTSREDNKGKEIAIGDYESLIKAKISNEAIRLQPSELTRLNKPTELVSLVFPISYHHNLFGFLLLNVDPERYQDFDLEMSYIQILINIVANSFQNYLSFQNLRKEIDKKELVTRELLRFDKQLNSSRKSLLELQKHEIMGEMLPVIFHKLKNKLTPILGYTQIMLQKTEDENVAKRLSKIEKNANELTDQLNMLRDYFKTEDQPTERENLNNIITRLKPYFNEIDSLYKITVQLDLDYELPEDALIPGQIEALILNLIENSVLSIREKKNTDGKVIIKTQAQTDTYTLSIRDNGIGMNEEEMGMIWIPFYTKFSGKTGLGLTVCEKVLTNHEADRLVESVAGEYTEFKFTFKRRPHLISDSEEVMPVEEQISERKARILIVDDEAYLVDLMQEILLNEGNFDIYATTSGADALKMLGESFDLVISDMRMPEVSGMDIYNFLRTVENDPNILMVTADPFSEDVAMFLKENKLDYLKKPFQLMEFKKRVLEKLS